jgi:hypothetical protein
MATPSVGCSPTRFDKRFRGHVRNEFALRSTHRWTLVFALASGGAHAKILHDGFGKAWERQPASHVQPCRAAELSARGRAAGTWVPASPSASARELGDGFIGYASMREFEIESAVPLSPAGYHSISWDINNE